MAVSFAPWMRASDAYCPNAGVNSMSSAPGTASNVPSVLLSASLAPVVTMIRSEDMANPRRRARYALMAVLKPSVPALGA